MSKIQNILFATALGPAAPYVFRYALLEAEKHEARVTILHVMEPLNPFGRHLVELHIARDQAEDPLTQAHEYARRKIEERIRNLCDSETGRFEGGKDLVGEIRVIQGEPHLEIINQSRALPADLLVIGSHRHSAIGEIMLGRTANRVMHHSEVPVLLVRIPEGFHEEDY